jgi:hypothetical protein
MGSALNPLMPVVTTLSNDQQLRNKAPNITSITTHSGQEDIGKAHSSYWTSDTVLNTIAASYRANMSNTQSLTSTKQGATR